MLQQHLRDIFDLPLCATELDACPNLFDGRFDSARPNRHAFGLKIAGVHNAMSMFGEIGNQEMDSFILLQKRFLTMSMQTRRFIVLPSANFSDRGAKANLWEHLTFAVSIKAQERQEATDLSGVRVKSPLR